MRRAINLIHTLTREQFLSHVQRMSLIGFAQHRVSPAPQFGDASLTWASVGPVDAAMLDLAAKESSLEVA